MGFYEMISSALTNPLFAGPVIGGVVMLLAYADSKLRDIPREKETYYKLFIVTSLIATLVVYLIVEEFTKTDEFLTQAYDTNVPKELLGATVGGAMATVSSAVMKGPSMTVDMDSLVPGDIADPVQMKSERVHEKKKKHRH